MELVRSQQVWQEPHELCAVGQASEQSEQNEATPEPGSHSDGITDGLVGKAYECFHRLQQSRPSYSPTYW